MDYRIAVRAGPGCYFSPTIH